MSAAKPREIESKRIDKTNNFPIINKIKSTLRIIYNRYIIIYNNIYMQPFNYTKESYSTRSVEIITKHPKLIIAHLNISKHLLRTPVSL